MSTGLALVLVGVFLAGNAFFVGAEFAVISARRSAIEPRAREGDRRARTVLWAMEHVSLMLACAQLGITVCSTSLGLVAEPALAHLVAAPLRALGAGPGTVTAVALVVALLVVVYLHVVLGEMVPKNLAVSGPDRAVLAFGPPLVWLARVLRPMIAVLNWVANHAVRLVGVEPRNEVTSSFTAEQVQSIVERSAADGLLSDAQGLLSGSLEFSDRTARDVMVPLGDVVGIDEGATPDEVEHLVARTGFSRFPVREDTRLVGYLHVKDVLYADDGTRWQPVPGWRVRALAVVGPDDEVEDTLAAMQRSGSHLARVDDGGAAVGVVFLEDILEELVGEVRDAMQHTRLPDDR